MTFELALSPWQLPHLHVSEGEKSVRPMPSRTVDTTVLDARAAEIDAQIPNLFISKEFKKSIELTGDRVPSYLNNIS
jgi:hypothetical protein